MNAAEISAIISFFILLFGILGWRATQRPSVAEREESLTQRIGNSIGPAAGRYQGENYTLDLLDLEVEEQYETPYSIIRHLSGRFKGMTMINVRIYDASVSVAELDSRIESSDDIDILDIRANQDGVLLILPETGLREVQSSFDVFR
jgi:hypothetical protein